MKSCPTCNRTFEDTFTFCLVDGAILSAPFDPHAVQKIPEPRHAEPPPTQLMPANTLPANDPVAVNVAHQAEALAKTITALPNLGVAGAPPQDHRTFQSPFLIEPAARVKVIMLYILLVCMHQAIVQVLWLLPLNTVNSQVGAWSYILIKTVFLEALWGGIQLLFLRKYLRSLGPWIFATVVGGLLGFFFNELFWRSIADTPLNSATFYIYDLITYVIIMGLIATSQWLILRRLARSAWLWIVAGLIGGGLNFVLIRMLGKVGLNGFSFFYIFLDVLSTGLSIGLIQGLCLIYLRKKVV
jgi:hypothetical protein